MSELIMSKPQQVTTMHNEEKAKLIVEFIITDIESRKGLGNEWESIDEEIQKEIKDEWTKRIMVVLQ